MSVLYLKITTIPSKRPGLLDELRANVSAPSRLSNADSIKKWLEENREAAALEALVKTAYDGTLGEVAAIAWAFDGEPITCLNVGEFGGSEAGLLNGFSADLQLAIDENPGSRAYPTIVGHNAIGFDLRFLFQRYVINRVIPAIHLCHDVRYSGEKVFDTMQAWAGWNKFVSLQELALAIGFPAAPPTLGAAEVQALVVSNQHEVLSDLLVQDLELVRNVHKAMQFDFSCWEVADAQV